MAIPAHTFKTWFLGRHVVADIDVDNFEEACFSLIRQQKEIIMDAEVYSTHVRMKSQRNACYDFPVVNFVDVIRIGNLPTVFGLLMSSAKSRYSVYFFSIRPFTDKEQVIYQQLFSSGHADPHFPVLMDTESALLMLRSAVPRIIGFSRNEKRPRPQQAHPPAAFQPQRQAEAARVAAVDAASPLVGGGVEQRRRVVAHVAATRHATTSSLKKEGPEDLCSSSTWSSLSSASSGAVVGAAHQQQEEQQKYPAAPDYSPVSFQKVQKRKSGLHLFQRANSHSLEAKRRQAHLLHHQSSIQSHHQFAQSQPNHLEQSLTVSSTTTSTSTTSGPETTGSASIFPPPPHHPQTTTTRRAGDAAIPSPASAVSSPRRLKRLSSFFRRANSEAFESAGPYSTDAPGTADRGPTARTVGAGQQSHHQLTRQQSLGIQNITLDKENISPQSMPDSATDDQKVDLEKLLKSETARAPFQNFLQQQFCIENLNFYLAVEEYRKLRDANKRSEFGRHIYERHFTPNSIEPVNIDNATSKGIIECIQNENYSEEMYDVAQYQIFHLLKYDVWPRYLNSGGKAPGKEPEPKKGTQNWFKTLVHGRA